MKIITFEPLAKCFFVVLNLVKDLRLLGTIDSSCGQNNKCKKDLILPEPPSTDDSIL
jgi:hypothetical protein